MKLDKDQTITISWSTLLSVLTSLGACWLFAAPIAQQALAGEIGEQVRPLTDAFTVLLTQQIQSQKDAVTALTFKKTVTQPSAWSLDDEKQLRDAMDTLEATVAALKSIREAQRK